MIEIEQLRYVRIGTRDLAGAADFAARILGLEAIDRTDALATFRSDMRDHTLAFVAGAATETAVGFEVRTRDNLDAAALALAARGLHTGRGTAADCAARKVKDCLWFRDHSGNRIELVVRPLNSGWRFFPSRDAGVRGLAAVALRTTAHLLDEQLWTTVFNARVSDWAGRSAYLQFDQMHHRLALHVSNQLGILAVEYDVESVDLLMRNSYALQANQIRPAHGPGRRPTSGQLFLTFPGPEGCYFSFVAEADTLADTHRPRQFGTGRAGSCAWGSDCTIPEFLDGTDPKKA